MRITTFATWKSMDDFITGNPADHSVSHEYEGPTAKLDRAAQAAAKSAAGTAGQTASTLGSEASTEHSELAPFFVNEMNAKHGYTPEQTNELLDYAEAGTGGTLGSVTGQADLEAARTRNASGFTKSLDEAARDKMKANAGMSEGIAAQDVEGAKRLNQEGAAGLEGLYGTDTAGQLKAMGQENEDINTQIAAGKSGWLQNALDAMNTIDGLSKRVSGGISNLDSSGTSSGFEQIKNFLSGMNG